MAAQAGTGIQEDHVNRPFYAFGVLLAGLGVTMLAVGNTSRATRLQRTSGNPNHEIETKAEPEEGGFCGCYVLVLPDAISGSEGHSCDSVEQPRYDEGCGLDRLSGRVYPILPAAGDSFGSDDFDCGGCDWWASQAAMRPAVVELAATDCAPQFPAAVDLRAHYDAAYDAIVNGEPGEIVEHGPSSPFEVDQALQLFQSLLVEPHSLDRQSASAPRVLAAGQWLFHRIDERLEADEARAVALGAAHFIRQKLEAAGLFDEWQLASAMAGRDFPPGRFSESFAEQSPGWEEYADWMDSPRVDSAKALASERFAAVDRSSREVLLFAAATLNHVAEWMHQTADQLSAVASTDEFEFSRRASPGNDLK